MYNKNVLIVVLGNTGNEPEAIRQTLESFGFFVAIKYIGRPNDFIAVLSDNTSDYIFDYLIISCHGDDGSIIMPILGDSVYENNEPKGNFSANTIIQYLSLTNKVIINLGCTTGEKNLYDVFSKNNIYIAPLDNIDGTSALFFVLKFFYEISQNKHSIKDAFNLAKDTDSETNLFIYRK